MVHRRRTRRKRRRKTRRQRRKSSRSRRRRNRRGGLNVGKIAKAGRKTMHSARKPLSHRVTKKKKHPNLPPPPKGHAPPPPASKASSPSPTVSSKKKWTAKQNYCAAINYNDKSCKKFKPTPSQSNTPPSDKHAQLPCLDSTQSQREAVLKEFGVDGGFCKSGGGRRHYARPVPRGGPRRRRRTRRR